MTFAKPALLPGRCWLIVLLLSVVGLCPYGSYLEAQSDPVAKILQEVTPPPAKSSRPQPEAPQPVMFSEVDRLAHEFRMTQERYKLLECLLLAGVALLSLFAVLFFLTRANCSASMLVNASGLVFVIFGTLILVILAEVDEQLTAAIGVLGAVAGYLFGTMRRIEGGDNTASSRRQPAE